MSCIWCTESSLSIVDGELSQMKLLGQLASLVEICTDSFFQTYRFRNVFSICMKGAISCLIRGVITGLQRSTPTVQWLRLFSWTFPSLISQFCTPWSKSIDLHLISPLRISQKGPFPVRSLSPPSWPCLIWSGHNLEIQWHNGPLKIRSFCYIIMQ